MSGTKFDLDKAQRYYDSDEEEEAVRIIDRLLEIENLSAKDAVEKLKSWGEVPDLENLHRQTMATAPDGSIGLSISKGLDGDYKKWGYAGVMDALKLRSLALSAIMFGSNKKDKDKFYTVAVVNAQTVMKYLSELRFIEEAHIWCVAAQPVVLSGDPHIATMSPAMHYFAIEAYPQLKNAANIRHFIDTSLRQMARHHRNSSEFTEMMQKLEAILASNVNTDTKKAGFFASLFRRND